MNHEFSDFHNFTMPPQPPRQQASRYTNSPASTVSTPRPCSTNPNQNAQASQLMAPPQNSQGTMLSPLVQSAQAPTDPLEQRILDLLYPYRDECFDPEAEVSAEQERMALVLCENIAFLMRHNQSSYGKSIDPNDVSMCSRNWQGMKKGNGPAGIGVFVNGGNGFTHTVCRVQVLKGQSAVEQLSGVLDGFMATFFPNPPA